MLKQINSFSEKNEKGFTLVEILVSLVILLILVVAFVPLFTYVAQAMASNKARAAAVEIATMKMEELRALPYDAKDENYKIDPDKPQLGLIKGDPVGSVKPTETVTVGNREFLVTTDISWGDEARSHKIVSVTVESPGVFSDAVKIINKFDTMAAREGIDIQLGRIMVEVFDSEGNPISNHIKVTAEKITEETDSFFSTEDLLESGKVVLKDLPNGVYEVTVEVPPDLSIPPDLYLASFDGNSLVEKDIIITYNKLVKLSYVMDDGANLKLDIRDQHNNSIATNIHYKGGTLNISWYESEPNNTINVLTTEITNNEISSGKLIQSLWPVGNYIISLRIHKDIGEDDFRLFNEYDQEDIKLSPRTTTNVTVNLDSPPIKVALLAKEEWVKHSFLFGGALDGHVEQWDDLSGNNYHAKNDKGNHDLRPRWKDNKEVRFQTATSSKKQYLIIPEAAECKNNFTVFVSADPLETRTDHATSDNPSNTAGTSGQKYLLYPTPKHHLVESNKTDVAGMGISLGTNGVTVYEHGDYYMPAKARYNETFNKYSVIAVKYYHDPTGDIKPTPSIYVNGDHVTTGLPSNKSAVYSPLRIGGDYPFTTEDGFYQEVHGFYKGDLRAVLIYGSALDDYNIGVVSEFLYDNYR